MRRKGWLWISWCDLLEPEKTPEPAQPWTMHEAALAVESMTTAHLREVEVAEETEVAGQRSVSPVWVAGALAETSSASRSCQQESSRSWWCQRERSTWHRQQEQSKREQSEESTWRCQRGQSEDSREEQHLAKGLQHLPSDPCNPSHLFRTFNVSIWCTSSSSHENSPKICKANFTIDSSTFLNPMTSASGHLFSVGFTHPE